jgi:Transcriptional regulator
MSRKITNAKEFLMERCRQFLLNNRDGLNGRLDVRELTAQCGMAAGTFYHYFRSKDDLVMQVMGRDWQEMLDAIDAEMGRTIPLYDKVRGIYELIAAFGDNYRHSAMELLGSKPENYDFQRREMKRLYDRMAAFLQEEKDRGSLSLGARADSAAYLLVQLFIAAGRNPEMNFDELWGCMNFQDISAYPGAAENPPARNDGSKQNTLRPKRRNGKE